MSDEVDRDPEMPTQSGVQYRGKTPVPPPVQILSDGDSSDDDCRALEVIEATPLRYSFPVSTPPAASGAPAGGAEPRASGASRIKRVARPRTEESLRRRRGRRSAAPGHHAEDPPSPGKNHTLFVFLVSLFLSKVKLISSIHAQSSFGDSGAGSSSAPPNPSAPPSPARGNSPAPSPSRPSPPPSPQRTPPRDPSEAEAEQQAPEDEPMPDASAPEMDEGLGGRQPRRQQRHPQVFGESEATSTPSNTATAAAAATSSKRQQRSKQQHDPQQDQQQAQQPKQPEQQQQQQQQQQHSNSSHRQNLRRRRTSSRSDHLRRQHSTSTAIQVTCAEGDLLLGREDQSSRGLLRRPKPKGQRRTWSNRSFRPKAEPPKRSMRR